MLSYENVMHGIDLYRIITEMGFDTKNVSFQVKPNLLLSEKKMWRRYISKTSSDTLYG